MSGWFAVLVVGFFVVWILLLVAAVLGRRGADSPLQQRVEQIRAATRARVAEAQTRARAARPKASVHRSPQARVAGPQRPAGVPSGTVAPSPPQASAPAAAPATPPASATTTSPAAAGPPSAWSVLRSGGRHPAASEDSATDESSALDTTLSPSDEPLDDVAEHDPIMDGPQVVPLTDDQRGRVLALMEQGAEVMAVRLVCDETRAGILDAHTTVRSLVGLPSPY